MSTHCFPEARRREVIVSGGSRRVGARRHGSEAKRPLPGTAQFHQTMIQISSLLFLYIYFFTFYKFIILFNCFNPKMNKLRLLRVRLFFSRSSVPPPRTNRKRTRGSRAAAADESLRAAVGGVRRYREDDEKARKKLSRKFLRLLFSAKSPRTEVGGVRRRREDDEKARKSSEGIPPTPVRSPRAESSRRTLSALPPPPARVPQMARRPEVRRWLVTIGAYGFRRRLAAEKLLERREDRSTLRMCVCA